VLHTRKVLGEAPDVFRRDLEEIGIRVDVVALADPEFFDLVRGGGASFWMNRFGCTTGDAHEFLVDALHSTDAERHLGSLNYTGLADAELDRRIEAIAGLERDDERRDAIQQVMSRAMADVLVVPLYNDQDVFAIDRAYAWTPRGDSQVRAAEITLRD
jgi:ABC-type oligopeptide transport system substrate-binding subunit